MPPSSVIYEPDHQAHLVTAHSLPSATTRTSQPADPSLLACAPAQVHQSPATLCSPSQRPTRSPRSVRVCCPVAFYGEPLPTRARCVVEILIDRDAISQCEPQIASRYGTRHCRPRANTSRHVQMTHNTSSGIPCVPATTFSMRSITLQALAGASPPSGALAGTSPQVKL